MPSPKRGSASRSPKSTKKSSSTQQNFSATHAEDTKSFQGSAQASGFFGSLFNGFGSMLDAFLKEQFPGISKSVNRYSRQSNLSPQAFLSIASVAILLVGTASVVALTGLTQDVRQQASVGDRNLYNDADATVNITSKRTFSKTQGERMNLRYIADAATIADDDFSCGGYRQDMCDTDAGVSCDTGYSFRSLNADSHEKCFPNGQSELSHKDDQMDDCLGLHIIEDEEYYDQFAETPLALIATCSTAIFGDESRLTGDQNQLAEECIQSGLSAEFCYQYSNGSIGGADVRTRRSTSEATEIISACAENVDEASVTDEDTRQQMIEFCSYLTYADSNLKGQGLDQIDFQNLADCSFLSVEGFETAASASCEDYSSNLYSSFQTGTNNDWNVDLLSNVGNDDVAEIRLCLTTAVESNQSDSELSNCLNDASVNAGVVADIIDAYKHTLAVGIPTDNTDTAVGGTIPGQAGPNNQPDVAGSDGDGSSGNIISDTVQAIVRIIWPNSNRQGYQDCGEEGEFACREGIGSNAALTCVDDDLIIGLDGKCQRPVVQNFELETVDGGNCGAEGQVACMQWQRGSGVGFICEEDTTRDYDGICRTERNQPAPLNCGVENEFPCPQNTQNRTNVSNVYCVGGLVVATDGKCHQPTTAQQQQAQEIARSFAESYECGGPGQIACVDYSDVEFGSDEEQPRSPEDTTTCSRGYVFVDGFCEARGASTAQQVAFNDCLLSSDFNHQNCGIIAYGTPEELTNRESIATQVCINRGYDRDHCRSFMYSNPSAVGSTASVVCVEYYDLTTPQQRTEFLNGHAQCRGLNYARTTSDAKSQAATAFTNCIQNEDPSTCYRERAAEFDPTVEAPAQRVLLTGGSGLTTGELRTGGEVQVEGYCTEVLGYDRAYRDGSGEFSWFCGDSEGNDIRLDEEQFQEICELTFPNASFVRAEVQDIPGSSNDAFNWRCLGVPGTEGRVALSNGQGTRTGAAKNNGEFEVEQFCEDLGLDVGHDDNDWWCVNPDGSERYITVEDFNQICEDTYEDAENVIAELRSIPNTIPAYSWRCYGDAPSTATTTVTVTTTETDQQSNSENETPVACVPGTTQLSTNGDSTSRCCAGGLEECASGVCDAPLGFEGFCTEAPTEGETTVTGASGATRVGTGTGTGARSSSEVASGNSTEPIGHNQCQNVVGMVTGNQQTGFFLRCNFDSDLNNTFGFSQPTGFIYGLQSTQPCIDICNGADPASVEAEAQQNYLENYNRGRSGGSSSSGSGQDEFANCPEGQNGQVACHEAAGRPCVINEAGCYEPMARSLVTDVCIRGTDTKRNCERLAGETCGQRPETGCWAPQPEVDRAFREACPAAGHSQASCNFIFADECVRDPDSGCWERSPEAAAERRNLLQNIYGGVRDVVDNVNNFWRNIFGGEKELLNGGVGQTDGAAMNGGIFQVEFLCNVQNLEPENDDNVWWCKNESGERVGDYLGKSDFDRICGLTYPGAARVEARQVEGAGPTPAESWRCFGVPTGDDTIAE